MKNIITANTGGLPHIGEKGSEQTLRRAFHDFDTGKITRSELIDIERGITVLSIGCQQQTGLDIITDGQIGWSDPVSHIMGALSGVQIGSLVRFFDTNTYFRQPVITSKINGTISILVDEFNFANRIATSPVKPVITGPYTLARLSINQAYPNDSSLFEDIGHVVAREVAALAQAGASIIQIDEPAILHNPEDMPILRTLLEEIAAVKGEARLALCSYFGDAAPLYEDLQLLPVDILCLDFTYSPHLTEVIISSGSEKVLGLGVIDGRNTRIETPVEIFPILVAVLSMRGVTECFLNPSCSLEYLPMKNAIAKLSNLVDLRNTFMGRNI